MIKPRGGYVRVSGMMNQCKGEWNDETTWGVCKGKWNDETTWGVCKGEWNDEYSV